MDGSIKGMSNLETLDALAARYSTALAAFEEARDDLRAYVAETSPAAPKPVPSPISDYAAAKHSGISINTIRKWRGKTSSNTATR